MKIEELIVVLENEFEEIEKGVLKPSTNFRDIDEWSSIYSLIIVALVETEYGVVVNLDDLRNIQTVQDLYALLIDRMK